MSEPVQSIEMCTCFPWGREAALSCWSSGPERSMELSGGDWPPGVISDTPRACQFLSKVILVARHSLTKDKER